MERYCLIVTPRTVATIADSLVRFPSNRVATNVAKEVDKMRHFSAFVLR